MAARHVRGNAFGHPHHFRVRLSAIGEGWGLFKDEWPTWVIAGGMVMLGNWALFGAAQSVFGMRLPQGGGGFRVAVPPARNVVPAVIIAVIDGVLVGGLFRLACLQVRGRRIKALDVFGVTDVFLDLAIGSALLGAALTVAATFCFVPALLLAGVWMFTIPLIVDARLRTVDAIARSWGVLKHQWLSAAVFHLVASLIAGLGFCCCAGVFLTMPLYCLSIAVLYRDAFLVKGEPAFEKPVAPDPDF